MSGNGAAVLADLSDDSPAGESMEFDPNFDALERACQGKPETQYGDTITPAVPPEWKEAQSLASALLERTRDLRILSLLAMARLNLSGLTPFAEVLAQIRHQVEERWDAVHPRLDPEDDNDPTMRANALFRLQDPAHVIRVIRTLPLATSLMTGPVSWRDISIFEGTVDPEEGRDKPSEAFIRGAFSKTNSERLALLRDSVGQAILDVVAIPAVFDEKAGYGTGPDLGNLSKLLTDIQRMLKRYEPADDDEPAEMQADTPPDEAGASDDSVGAYEDRPRPVRSGGTNIRSISSVTRRDDALYLLDIASAYFRDNEPSSPLPMLLDRARRLAGMNFMDLLRDLAPDGLQQAQVIAGTPADQDSG